MITEILLILCTIMCLYLSYNYAYDRPKGFPPGPPRMPIFGSYLFMMMVNFKFLHKAVLKFTKWYKSDIVGFYVGSFPVVAVHSAETVREVLNNTDLDGRPLIYVAEIRHPKNRILGIFFGEGSVWKEQRRFILRYLRDFGFGRRFQELELVMQEEITNMFDLIRNGPRYEHEKELIKPGGYKILLPYFFNTVSANSVFHMMWNDRVPRSDQADLITLMKLAMQFQRTSDDYGKILSIIPWIRYIFPNWSCYNKLIESNKFIYEYFEKTIQKQINTYDENYERHFVDLYIKEMRQAEAEGNKESSFHREQFIMSLIDFAFPALSAIGTQLSFLIQYLILYPEVLKRIQLEIDEVVGCGRLPTLEDREHLHYTEATIREGLRIETLVPSDIPHKALKDTQIFGYNIPKGTIIIPSLYALHSDKRIWGDPQNFRPERFLNDAGKLILQKDVSLPFGAGKRLCAGETFARNTLFLITSSICQNFEFVLGPDDELPDLSKTLSGLITSPPDFWLQLKNRK